MAYNLGLSQSANLASNIGALSPLDGGGGEFPTPPPSSDWADYNGSNDKTPVSFDQDVYSIKSCKISDSSFALVYNNFLEEVVVIIGTLNGSGVATFGSPYTIITGSQYDAPDISLLDSTHLLVTYADYTNSIEAVVVTFSGTTVSSVGTPVTVETNTSTDTLACCAALSSTVAFVAYRKGSTSIVTNLSISGTTITVGTNFNYRGAQPTGIDIVALSSTRALLLSTYAAGVEVEAKLLNVVANSPNVLSTLTVKDAAITARYPSIGVVDSTNAVIAYHDSVSNNTYAVVVTATADVLAKGTEISAMTVDIDDTLSVSIPESGYAVVVGAGAAASSWPLQRVVLSISGTTLTAGSTITTNDAYYIAYGVAVSADYVIVAYTDELDVDFVQVLTP